MEALKASGKKFLVLTNNSIFTPRDLRARLLGSGIDIPEEAIWTSALATADFLSDQRPGGSAYVVGEAGLTNGPARHRLRDDRPQTPTTWCWGRRGPTPSRRSRGRSG